MKLKALTKWNPFRSREPLKLWRSERWVYPFQEMEQQMSVMMERMDQMLGHWSKDMGSGGLKVAGWTPRVDIVETDKEYLVKAELPEVKKDEIKVLVRDHTLSISGERKAEKEEKGKKFHRIERTYGGFERSFMLPDEADAGRITSEFKDGVLNVHLPKVPVPESKMTEVKVM